jgi:glycosyltransferase involved in cell wall biosynthesis
MSTARPEISRVEPPADSCAPQAADRRIPRVAPPFPRVCFVAPHNFALLARRADLAHIGGAELQRVLLARELASRGWPVSFVVNDHGQPDGLDLDGIRVYSIATTRLQRSLPPRLRKWLAFWAALARADADIYYQRTAGTESAQVAAWCRAYGRTFIFGVANEPECDWRLGGPTRPLHERWLYYAGLRTADAVIAQTSAQRALLWRNFARRAAVVPNSIAAPPAVPPHPAERLAAPRVLWVGRLRPHKRPDWVALLADQCPELHFDVVGAGPPDCPYVQTTCDALRARPNVTLHGYRPHADIAACYDRAAALLLTSAWEGYPNVFLEAWARGVPTIATLDPDDAIARHGLGAVARNPDTLGAGLRALLADPAGWADCAQRCIVHVRQHHGVANAADAFAAVLHTTLGARPRKRRRGVTG